MCISPDALLAGLLLRMTREGYSPTDDDLRGLLGSGCPRDRLDRALAARPDPVSAEARVRLARVADAGCGRRGAG